MPLPGPREIPSQEKILAVSELDVLNENGRAVTFGSLFTKEKTLAVFIRTCRHLIVHFPSLTCVLRRPFLVRGLYFPCAQRVP